MALSIDAIGYWTFTLLHSTFHLGTADVDLVILLRKHGILKQALCTYSLKSYIDRDKNETTIQSF